MSAGGSVMGLLNAIGYGVQAGGRGLKILTGKTTYLNGLGNFSGIVQRALTATDGLEQHQRGRAYIDTVHSEMIYGHDRAPVPAEIIAAFKKHGILSVNITNAGLSPDLSANMVRFGLRMLATTGIKNRQFDWSEYGLFGATGERAVTISCEKPGIINLSFYVHDFPDDASFD